MSGVGSTGLPGGARSVTGQVADAIVDGEKEVRELAQDFVEDGSKENHFRLTQAVERQALGIKAMASAQSANNKAVNQAIANLKG